MDGLTFLQWFFILAAGASIIGVPLAVVSRKNNKEMKAILQELIGLNKNIASLQAENHKETMHALEETARILETNHKETMQAFEEMTRILEANHKETMQVLNKNHSETMQVLNKGHSETMQVLDKIVELFKRNFK